MIVYLIKSEEIRLMRDCINVVSFKDGNFILPNPQGMICYVKMLFTLDEPSGTVRSREYPIKLGDGESYLIEFASDTQPAFIFLPEEGKWFILSQGNFIMRED